LQNNADRGCCGRFVNADIGDKPLNEFVHLPPTSPTLAAA
jgi:hypothetical protein